MLFNILTFLLFFHYSHITFVKQKKNCKNEIKEVSKEMNDWGKYGVERTPRGPVTFPTKCTPFMKSLSMIPLLKRPSNGVDRERYLGKDCNIYEWDSQHGAFEFYESNSSRNSFVHKGEKTVINGTFDDKKDSKRNNNYTETGLDGLSLKNLCDKFKSGLDTKTLDKIKNKFSKRLTCFP